MPPKLLVGLSEHQGDSVRNRILGASMIGALSEPRGVIAKRKTTVI